MNLHKIIISEIKKFQNEQSGKTVRLYHRVGDPSFQTVKSVIDKGLVPHDNGEIGAIIWFSANPNDYTKNKSFVLAYDLELSKNGVTNNEYGIVYDGQNGFAHKSIPFKELEVIRIPVGMHRNNILTNEDFLEDGIFKMTPKRTVDCVIYRDLFNMFVQPYVSDENYIEQFSAKNKIVESL